MSFSQNYRDLIQNFKDLKEYTRFAKSSPNSKNFEGLLNKLKTVNLDLTNINYLS